MIKWQCESFESYLYPRVTPLINNNKWLKNINKELDTAVSEYQAIGKSDYEKENILPLNQQNLRN